MVRLPMLVAFSLALATVPLGRGRLGALADLQLRRWWLLAAGIGLQVAALSGVPSALGAGLHGASYLAGAAYLVSNLHLSGLWWIAVGGAMNVVGIAANGGTLPASPGALDAAGIDRVRGASFANSAALDDPKLAFLGDIFAIPEWLPFSNVFSLGDIVIWAGIFITVHRATGSRLVMSAPEPAGHLGTQPRARALWTAQCLTWTAAWLMAAAVIAVTVGRPGALASAVALGLSGWGAALLLGGPLVDRFNPPALLACTAFAQACGAGVLLIAPRASMIGPIAVWSGFLTGLARPAALVLLAEIVARKRLVAAVGILEATLAAIGAIAAGVSVPVLLSVGARPALAAATLLWGVAALAWSVMPARRRPAPARATLWRDLLGGVRCLEDSPVIPQLALLMAAIGAGVGLVAGDPFVALGLTWRRATPLDLAAGCLGVGVVLGALAATSLRRRPLSVLGPAFVVAGLGLFCGATGGVAMWGLAGWSVGGLAVGLSATVLIAAVVAGAPPTMQGRLLSLGLAAVIVGLGTGYSLGGALSDTGGPVATGAAAGAVLVAAGVVAARTSRVASVPEFGVYESDQRPSRREPLDVALEQREQPGIRLTDDGVGDMGRDEAVVEVPERVAFREGFRIGDVEPGSRDETGTQGVDQRVGDDMSTAGDVDEVTPWPHGRELVPADDAASLRSEAQGDHHEVGAPEGVQKSVDSDGPCRTCQWLGISADDCCLHSEGSELIQEGAGDTTGAENGHSRPVEGAQL
ncbi:MAG: DUF5317 family protein [Actinobacteria bacterium]|nr:DUF5317 family protein [Actinomycetota bacterium]